MLLTKVPDYLFVKTFTRVDISYRFLFLFSLINMKVILPFLANDKNQNKGELQPSVTLTKRVGYLKDTFGGVKGLPGTQKGGEKLILVFLSISHPF